MRRVNFLVFLFLATVHYSFGQYSQQDSLRGSLNPMRTCYDVFYYDLQLRVMPDDQFIIGSNTIHYQVTEDFDVLQVDLFRNLAIIQILHAGKPLTYKRKGNATFVYFDKVQTKGTKAQIEIFYSGKPTVAKQPPWDGGFAWKKDAKGQHWIGVACEGIGASLWWPNKDHLSEEPDSMRIYCEVPTGLFCVANGQLREEKKLEDGYTSYDWLVSYPINNYNVTLNIAQYVHFQDVYVSPADSTQLALDYYVLPDHLEQAKKQFQQVKTMLACYEKLFGKYPFWRDGFALVETPYLGMEHQGAIAYGNGYENGYLGSDLSGTGVGKLFDYIIIHEAGHEYWGNSVSTEDHAELWIHESWCTYTEILFIECKVGKEAADTYVNGYRKRVGNRAPIVAPLGVNASGSGDMYFKGALMLHALRNVVDNDPLWFQMLYNLAQHFEHQVTNTKEVVTFVNQQLGQDFTYFFEHYLYYPQLPILEQKVTKDGWMYRWKSPVEDFSLPLKIVVAGKEQVITPTTTWQTLKIEKDEAVEVKEKLYYIEVK
ncbi:MAG: M1 family metallopeptidase [Thermonemataceae bacterium]